jgi:hypothetical protein
VDRVPRDVSFLNKSCGKNMKYLAGSCDRKFFPSYVITITTVRDVSIEGPCLNCEQLLCLYIVRL